MDEIPKTRKGKNGGLLLNTQPGFPSTNPNGRPKGSLNTKTILKRWLGAKGTFENDITGINEQMTVLDKIIVKQISKAIRNGDTQAFNAVLDRFEGKAKQIQEITGKDGVPVEINSTHTVVFKKYTAPEVDQSNETVVVVAPNLLNNK